MCLPRRLRAQVRCGVGCPDLSFAQVIGKRQQGEAGQESLEAYERVLTFLNLTDRSDPVTEMVASHILKCAAEGVIDRHHLYDCAVAALRS